MREARREPRGEGADRLAAVAVGPVGVQREPHEDRGDGALLRMSLERPEQRVALPGAVEGLQRLDRGPQGIRDREARVPGAGIEGAFVLARSLIT